MSEGESDGDEKSGCGCGKDADAKSFLDLMHAADHLIDRVMSDETMNAVRASFESLTVHIKTVDEKILDSAGIVDRPEESFYTVAAAMLLLQESSACLATSLAVSGEREAHSVATLIPFLVDGVADRHDYVQKRVGTHKHETTQ